jgi:mono/diheme cytochrome c family protein
MGSMSLLKVLGIGVFVIAPAALISAGLAGTEPSDVPAVPTYLMQIAQTTPEQPADAAPAEDAATTEEGAAEEPAVFTDEFLADPAHIAGGKAVWEGTCRGCHGAQAYPGKAPKLRPSKYTADFVFDRVTNGYKKMPAWKDIFTRDERMDVTAYVLSDDFNP